MKPKIQLWLELETRCNLRCQFCYNYWRGGDVAGPPALNTGDLINALDVLFEDVDCTSIAISGGEPLLHQNLFLILRHMHLRGVPMILTTNGTLLTPDLIQDLMGTGIVTFQIPFLSADARTHDDLSGSACFDQTLRALLLLKQAGANVVPVFVATQRNLGDFTSVLEVSAAFGIEEVIFNRFVPAGFGLQNRARLGVPSDVALSSTLVVANRCAETLNMRIFLGVPVALNPDVSAQLTRVTTVSRSDRPWSSQVDNWGQMGTFGDVTTARRRSGTFSLMSPQD